MASLTVSICLDTASTFWKPFGKIIYHVHYSQIQDLLKEIQVGIQEMDFQIHVTKHGLVRFQEMVHYHFVVV